MKKFILVFITAFFAINVNAQTNHIVFAKGLPGAVHLATSYYSDGEYEVSEDTESGNRVFAKIESSPPTGLMIKTPEGKELNYAPTLQNVKNSGLCFDNQTNTCFNTSFGSVCICGGYVLRTKHDF